MRDLLKIVIAGIILFFSPIVSAESYKLLILPDNIVTNNVAIDSYIYDATAEFFADEITAILNETDNIESKTVSDVRAEFKNNPTLTLAAKDLMYRFRNSYNVDYEAVKKIAKQSGERYVLLLTSTIDAENYILRRTWWDFFNVPGASVIDPAYKINTYAVLVDSKNNQKLWSDTYYKTISTVENRIITRGPSPQTEQLSRIKDYSKYICPQIAQNVQLSILPEDVLASESKVIDYDIGNIDNVFTKKYRHLSKEYDKVYAQKKAQTEDFIDSQKVKHNERKQRWAAKKQEQQKAKLEVQAKQVYDEAQYLNKINSETVNNDSMVKKAVFKSGNKEDQSLFDSIDIRKTRKNNLFGDYDFSRPYLRDYTK